jgi:hypothetical protein
VATTFATLINTLEALSVAGVNRRFTQGPPGSLKASELPAQWVTMPTGERPATAKNVNWSRKTADLVIAVEPFSLGTQPQNFEGMVRMMDAAETALRTVSLGLTQPTWTIRAPVVAVGEHDYWGVVVTVEIDG